MFVDSAAYEEPIIRFIDANKTYMSGKVFLAPTASTQHMYFDDIDVATSDTFGFNPYPPVGEEMLEVVSGGWDVIYEGIDSGNLLFEMPAGEEGIALVKDTRLEDGSVQLNFNLNGTRDGSATAFFRMDESMEQGYGARVYTDPDEGRVYVELVDTFLSRSLATGILSADFDLFAWHTLKVEFEDRNIKVFVDDMRESFYILSVEDMSYEEGWTGVGASAGTSPVWIDDISVSGDKYAAIIHNSEEASMLDGIFGYAEGMEWRLSELPGISADWSTYWTGSGENGFTIQDLVAEDTSVYFDDVVNEDFSYGLGMFTSEGGSYKITDSGSPQGNVLEVLPGRSAQLAGDNAIFDEGDVSLSFNFNGGTGEYNAVEAFFRYDFDSSNGPYVRVYNYMDEVFVEFHDGYGGYQTEALMSKDLFGMDQWHELGLTVIDEENGDVSVDVRVDGETRLAGTINYYDDPPRSGDLGIGLYSADEGTSPVWVDDITFDAKVGGLHHGYAAQAGDVVGGAESALLKKITVPAGGEELRLKFQGLVSPADGLTRSLKVWIDSVVDGQLTSGSATQLGELITAAQTPDWKEFQYDLGLLDEGEYEIIWVYTNSAATGAENETAWVDGVEIATVSEGGSLQEGFGYPADTQISVADFGDPAITSDGTEEFILQNSVYYGTSGFAAQAGNVYNGDVSRLTWEMEIGPYSMDDKLSFRYQIVDWTDNSIEVFVDDEVAPRASFTSSAGWELCELDLSDLSEGTHEVHFVYTGGSDGADGQTAWIDRVEMDSVDVLVTSDFEPGTQFGIIDLPGLGSDWTASGDELYVAQNTIFNYPYETLPAAAVFDSQQTGYYLTYSALPPGYATSGDRDFFLEDGTYYNGFDKLSSDTFAVQAGAVYNGDESVLEKDLTLYEDRELSFRWMVSAESGKTITMELMDGAGNPIETLTLDGAVTSGWQKYSRDLTGSASGTQYKLRWTYTDADSTGVAAATAWIDEVTARTVFYKNVDGDLAGFNTSTSPPTFYTENNMINVDLYRNSAWIEREITLAQDSKVTFNMGVADAVQSEASYNFRIFDDEMQQIHYDGYSGSFLGAGGKNFSHNLAAGTYTLRWTYSDASWSNGSRGFLRDINGSGGRRKYAGSRGQDKR